MPLIKGTTNIGDIYKGTTRIDSIYKGSTLVYSSGTWESWTTNYVFNTVIPTTINSKNVRNRAKVDTIYGNSVVENQLANKSQLLSGSYNGVVFTSNTTTGVVNGNGTLTNQAWTFLTILNINIPAGHYVFAYAKFEKANGNMNLRIVHSSALGSNILTIAPNAYAKVQQAPSTGYNVIQTVVYTNAAGTVVDNENVSNIHIIDLTREYPFDTPTSLTDVRVQNIIARIERGEILPYNTGSIKNVDMSEISTKDSNDNTLATLTFKYQGAGINTVHDTMQITSSAYVFTKNMWNYTFTGSESTWYAQPNYSDHCYLCNLSGLANIKSWGDLNSKGPILSADYLTVSNSNISSTDKAISIYTQSIRISDSSYVNNLSGFKSHIAGRSLTFQLTSPQTISIPKKHLGVVDLGNLSFSSYSAGAGNTYQADVSNMLSPQYSSGRPQGIYCIQYLADSQNSLTAMHNNSMLRYNGKIFIRDDSCLTPTELHTKLDGVYLFYETNTEVPDIADTISIQAGGTITTNSDVLPNIDFLVKCK